jgi:hypothetical protein
MADSRDGCADNSWRTGSRDKIQAPGHTAIVWPVPTSGTPSPQQPHVAVIQASVHAVAVELDLMQPLRAGWRLFDQLAELRLNECRKRSSGRTAYASEVGSGQGH